LNEGFNRLYEINFLKTLTQKLEEKRQKMPMPEFTGSSIYEFDDQVTAELHGFNGADDYYRQCSSKHFYEGVKTDLLVIHSKEDTLCPFEFAPFQVMIDNPYVRTCFTDEGGHVGFLSSQKGWLFRVLLQWLDQ
jgi:predicted alpha/beta-fold hydrolase